ncbi:Citrate lyase beta chain [Myxococcus hansupus]|uniref:Citrate lyase beta chain n=1 Tax=Pseudomyxococcus hansupus TaxID=1297742 RepID=A0A0H4X0T8_9BACT|nr:Citrate lyase beta chain [Myxococcus hansupus]
MAQAPSAWRTLLFIPQFAFARAAELSADCFIIDLQDAVPLAAKASARDGLVKALQGQVFSGRPVVVRINEPMSPELHQADLEACIGLPGLTALMPTLTTGPEDLDTLHARVSALEAARGLPLGSTRFLPLMETPAAVLDAQRIAQAGGGRNLGLMLGHGDLFRFTGALPHAELTLSHPRSALVMAARAAGIEPFDTPYTKIGDRIGLEKHAHEGRIHGFTGQCCLHPSQLDVVNRLMTPTASELAWARRVTEAQAHGALATLTRKVPGIATTEDSERGPASAATEGMAIVDGQLIGPPHLKAAHRLLGLAPLRATAGSGDVVVGRHVSHALDRPTRADDRLPNPYEMTATAGMRDLWVQSFYSHDRIVTSAPFAARLGLTTPETMPLPFMMGLYLAVCMSATHGAIYHLGFRNARQLAPLRVGDTYRQDIQVRAVRNTGDGKRAVVTTHRQLVRVSDGVPVFTVDKRELYHRQPESFPVSSAARQQEQAEHEKAQIFRAELLRRASDLPPSADKSGAGQSFTEGELLLHSFARPMGITANLALSTQFMVTHPIHLDHHRYDLGHAHGIVVSGGLVVAMTLAAAARDLHEVVWQELLAADNLRPVAPTQTVGALSYVLSRAPVEGMDRLEELVVRTLGVLDLTPSAELADVPLPRALFTLESERPSAYDERCREHGLQALEGRIVCVATRRILRLRA